MTAAPDAATDPPKTETAGCLQARRVCENLTQEAKGSDNAG